MTDCTTLAEMCPQCNAAALRPYGNGSKWICPDCHFLMPCCDGGDLSGTQPRDMPGGPPMA